MTGLSIQTSDGLTLEAHADEPENPTAALVLCHPHPKMGGTMNAPLLLALRDHMIGLGWAVLRFNFRGIGASQGTPGLGDDERLDARASLDAATKRWPGIPIAIAGWSFGGAVAVRVAAERDDLAACVAIAPAVKNKPGITAGLPPPTSVDLRIPTHFIVGINDDLVAPEDVVAWAEQAGATYTVMPGANHFFWAKYESLAREVTTFLESVTGKVP